LSSSIWLINPYILWVMSGVKVNLLVNLSIVLR
jgi:hypothetical protein